MKSLKSFFLMVAAGFLLEAVFLEFVRHDSRAAAMALVSIPSFAFVYWGGTYVWNRVRARRRQRKNGKGR